MNMKLHFFILLLFFSFSLSGQDNLLKVIEPEIGLTPFLDENALREELRKIQAVCDSFGLSECYSRLSERQIRIMEWDYESRSDYLDVGPYGDSWYNCGWPEKITATSVLKPSAGNDYKAENAHDFSLRTAWVEGAGGNGTGESITYCFPENNPPVTTVDIYNGYMKSEKAWRENARVRQLKLYINGAPYALLNLKDTIAQQSFHIGSHRPSKDGLRLKFEIREVYKGIKYDDTAISEIGFDGTGCLCFAGETMISTPGGSKAIGQLCAGDSVLSFNTETNTIETTVVVALASRMHTLYELDFGDVKIKLTEDHPLYSNGKYYSVVRNKTYGIETEQLFKGIKIDCMRDGELKTITLNHIRKTAARETTYTITKLAKNSLFFANGICAATEESGK